MNDTSLDRLALVDPRTGQRRIEVERFSGEAVADAVREVRRAQSTWGALTPAQRSGRLLELARRMEEDGALAAAEIAGTGKPGADAVAEVSASIDVLRFYAGAARTGVVPAAGGLIPGRESWVRWEPMGVVAAIVPWNYPLLMAMWRIAPALAAGNGVVLKPAETTPDTALILERLAASILGDGVLKVVTGDRETGRQLVQSDVDMIAFTGSVLAGQHIASSAGLRRVSLELGGNCPVVILPGSPGYTFDAIVAASTYNAGQSCAAPARIIAVRECYDAVVEGLAAAMTARRAGVDFGPLNNGDQARRFDEIVGASKARVDLVGTMRLADSEAGGYWRAGRILADLPDDDAAVLQEVFGPCLTVQVAADAEDAVRLANSVPHALAASVWGGNTGQVLSVAGRINAGEVWVNCHLEQTAELPHGGRGSSGHGTDLSTLAMTEYQRPKTITVRLD